MAISSNREGKLDFEADVINWKDAGLLKPSIFKSAIATIEKEYIITKIGSLSDKDIKQLDNMINIIC